MRFPSAGLVRSIPFVTVPGPALALLVLCVAPVSEALGSPYPIDPKVHVADKSLDPLDPGSIRSSVPNAFAYARYAAALADESAARARTDRDVLATLERISREAPVRSARALHHYALALDDAAKAAAIARVSEGRDGIDVPETMNARVALLRAQVESCRQEEAASEVACCRALMAPAFLVEEWTKLDDAGRRAAIDAASSDDFVGRYVRGRHGGPFPPSGSLFRLQGIKAWLAACAAPVAGLPRDLDALRAEIGDWRAASGDTLPPRPPRPPRPAYTPRPSRTPVGLSGWTVELHPTSRAKFAGRRIYRNETARISIAESLSADCEVTETEVIWERPGRELLFASYSTHAGGRNVEYGHFPGAGGREAVKFTPDSCMGCHYTFDERRFVVRAPNFEALNLTPRVVGGVLRARDDSRCAKPGETLVRHGG